MGAQIIQQPNGLFALFSTYTDTIVVIDATDDEVLVYFVALAIQNTTRHVTRVLEHVRSGHPDEAYHQFALTWDEAVAINRDQGGYVGTHYPPTAPNRVAETPRTPMPDQP